MKVSSSPRLVRPDHGSIVNEFLAYALLVVNLLFTALVKGLYLLPLISLLGVVSGAVITYIVYRPTVIGNCARLRLMIFWAMGLVLMDVVRRQMSLDFLPFLPNLVLLSCVPLMVVAATPPVRGFAWFFARGHAMWVFMLNLIYVGLVLQGPMEAWLLWGVAAFNLLVGAYLGFSTGPALRNPAPSPDRTRVAARALSASVLVGFLASALVVPPLYFLNTVEFASFPGLPPISDSNRKVLKVTFRGESPDNPYWEMGGAVGLHYVIPTGEYTWKSLVQIDKSSLRAKEREILPAFTREFLTSSLVRPSNGDEETYEYTIPLSDVGKVVRRGGAMTTLEGTLGSSIATPGESTLKDGVLEMQALKDPIWPHYGYSPEGDPNAKEISDRLFLALPGYSILQDPPENPRAYLEERAPKTVALARRLREESASDEEYVERVLAYFSNHLAYHFDHQYEEPEKNRLDYFLFEDRKGVCRHFANAFGMMMRLEGVPTRLVGGYMGGDFDPSSNTWTVRGRNAHIWAHVWMGEERGWVRVDPTAVVPVEKGIPRGGISSMFGALLDPLGGLSDLLPFSTQGAPSQDQTWGMMGLSLPRLPPLMGVVLFLAFACVALALWKMRRDLSRVAAEDRAWRRAMGRLKRAGVEIDSSMGPATVAAQVGRALPEGHPAAAQWAEAARAYEAWKYGGQPGRGIASQVCQSAHAVARARAQERKARRSG